MNFVQSKTKASFAFLVAVVLYCLVALLFLVDIVWFSVPQTAPAFPMTPRMRSKGPAPVRFVSPPKKRQPPSPPAQAQQPTPQQTIQKQTPPVQPQVKEQPKQAQPTPPKKPEPKPVPQPQPPMQNPEPQVKEQPKQSKPIPVRKSKKKKLPQQKLRKIKQKELEEKKEIKLSDYLPPRRSKERWFKQPEQLAHRQFYNQAYQAAAQPQMSSHEKQAIAAQLGQGFSNFIQKQKKEYARYSIPETAGHGAESLEYEMFAGKLVHAVCAESHASPLIPHNHLVKAHAIVVRITCDNQRKISNITFLTPSYDNQINDYIEKLLHTITPPQLPSIHPEPKLTMPLKIHVERQYYAPQITLVPA